MSAPEALQWSAENCPIGRAAEVIGDRWTLLLLREVFQGVRRFDDLRVRTAIPRQVLTARLRRLVDQGLLRREPYREPGQRARSEYRLTDKGIDLYPVLVALQQWGSHYLSDPAGPPVEFEHRGCGGEIDLVLRCRAGHAVTANRQVVGRLGPGARRRAAS
jgi:DNA-binding HxlR family transcriptional regulator